MASQVAAALPAGGVYDVVQLSTATCDDAACYKIFYTTDGTTPTTASAVYSAPISIAATATLKYFATDVAGNNETVKTQTYTIDAVPPVTTASPAGGACASAQSVTLACSDSAGLGCGNIYYTTDGSTPTMYSTAYSVPINIPSTMTIMYFAMDYAGNSEAVKSQSYTISP